MPNDTTPASIGAPAPRYKIGYRTDEWGDRSSTPGGIPDPAGAWVRYEDHVAALARAASAITPSEAVFAFAAWLTCRSDAAAVRRQA